MPDIKKLKRSLIQKEAVEQNRRKLASVSSDLAMFVREHQEVEAGSELDMKLLRVEEAYAEFNMLGLTM